MRQKIVKPVVNLAFASKREMETENEAYEDTKTINLSIHNHGQEHIFTFEPNSKFRDLLDRVEKVLDIPLSSQKYLIASKPGLTKAPFSEHQLSWPLSTLTPAAGIKSVILIGSTAAKATAFAEALAAAKKRETDKRSAQSIAKPTPYIDRQRALDDATYTFDRLVPLDYLPHPERSLRFLARLGADAGIRAAMRKWKWRVPLLTEMDPWVHTNHAADGGVTRTLGLNRNAGQVIELRLRTDAGDGYRDYRTIRLTLCHELTHNVWGDHDSRFWALCREVERVVDRSDWRTGGHLLGGMSAIAEPCYVPSDVQEEEKRGWRGGQYSLGSNDDDDDDDDDDKARKENANGESYHSMESEGLGSSMREIMAHAAEERLKQQNEQQSKGKSDQTMRD